MMKTAFGVIALTLVAGCSGGDNTGQRAQANKTEGTSPSTENIVAANSSAGVDAAKSADDVKIERKDDALEFSYEWPGEAVAIAPLNGWLKGHAQDQYKQAHAAAKEGQKLSKDGDYPFHQYSHSQSWDDVADTPAALVLLGEGYSFTGGAHGMPFTASLIWDRKAGKRLAIRDVLDMAKFSAAAKPAFCKELDIQRAKKRGDDAGRMAKESLKEFSECPDIAEQEIVPISDGGKALDTIHIIIGPYVAGPYVEGSYGIELPMTDALMAAVKPAYHSWFTALR